jgi:iron complex outermembrane receptor protein
LGGDFANEFRKLDAYALVNLQAAYEWQRWRASLRLNNLLDKAYSEDGAIGLDAFFTRRDAYFPAPERNVWLSARYVYD